jgi:DNA-binding FadR family transcriptional regulator
MAGACVNLGDGAAFLPGRGLVGGVSMPELAPAVTRSSAVAEHLAAEIERMPEGQRIGTKKELCSRLGVASATLTEAVRLLQERGLVTLRPGPKGGLFAARPDPLRRIGRDLTSVRDHADLTDGAVEVQRSLEELVVLDAARNRTSDDIVGLRDQMSRVQASRDDARAFFEEVLRLHQRVASCVSNTVLRTVYSGVLAYLESTAVRTEDRDEPPVDRHGWATGLSELIEAVIAQDETSCRAALRRTHSAQDRQR